MIALAVAITALAICALTWFADAVDQDRMRVTHVVIFICFVVGLVSLGFGIDAYKPSPGVTINLVPLAEKPLTPSK